MTALLKLWSLLNGKKTYLVVLGMVFQAVEVYMTGGSTVSELINVILVATGFATVRHGVASTK